ncbi:3',5'-nucleoside bisphosphate phosphatase-like [Hordeum vulgare subsp. vulgare]|uniref:Polymerase/histidinol phosphatase N-terminal domain-containing protein n=1 Tax=Hordeum vulgare subsp. vulgare TaxID=112509 RepID=A0A8I6Z3G6_HORVV|nr:3',5'-nucleoside bisphosphate phosphatase-like [Hordeum vulgare subsp. vulgare]
MTTTRPAATTEEEEDASAAANAAPPDADDREQQHKARPMKKKKKKKRRRAPSEEELAALRSVLRWARRGEAGGDDEAGCGHPLPAGRRRPRVAVELHAHSARSDGSLSPAALVERAHRNEVKVLALTDHDTMAGVAEAMETAKKFSIRIIPAVEISAVYSPSNGSGANEPVHVLAYYGSLGPAKSQELEKVLSSIREGRYTRAKEMLSKLRNLGMPLNFEDVSNIAGNGVAPGRVHVARAMVAAGYVDNLRQAFSRYLYDGGPAYATGSEPAAESVVQLICRTGGIAVLAHPWALKNHVPVIKDLKAAGLHAIEVYRSDGKLSGLSDLADTYELLKLGGSDYHGRDDKEESDIGSVDLPVLALFRFLEVAQPIWCNAMKENFATTTERKGCQRASSVDDLCNMCLSSSELEETDDSEVEVLRTEFADIILKSISCKTLIEQRAEITSFLH